MVDFETQAKLNGYSYHAPVVKNGESKLRDLYRDTEPLVFKTPRVEAHDCREDVMKVNTDKRLWEAQLLLHGLHDAYNSSDQLRNKPLEKDSKGRIKPDKLLFQVGGKGSAEGELNFPRGMTTTNSCDIIVADTMNHRIQRFNQFGVIKTHYGKKGKEPGQFNQPSGVAVLPNDDIVIADRKNKRIQLFESYGLFKDMVLTNEEPYAAACDEDSNIIISTVKGTIEIYDENLKLLKSFSSGPVEDGISLKYIAVDDRNQIFISDPKARNVTIYNYEGHKVHQFEPSASGTGLACCPSGITVNPAEQLLIADSLNHTVNLYSQSGEFIKELVGPSDSAGAVQQCVVGPEGHLIVTEYTTNGLHCIKIFRYLLCECHRTRPGSSKKSTTPVPTPDKT